MSHDSRSISRRSFFALSALALGCQGPSAKPQLVWGRYGISPGDFVKPRAVTLTADERLYIVDFTARIQAFDLDGKYLGIGWQTPEFLNGRPSGLSTANDGSIIASDSHYFTVRVYTPEGEERFTLGGTSGVAPGEFGYVSDAVQHRDGSFYISEFGVNERITHMDPSGKVIRTIGDRGSNPGQLNHTRALAFGPDGLLYVADACNHRLQVFSTDGRLVKIIGQAGGGPGEFTYPYDIAFGPRGDLYVVEYGNHRVQKLTPDGESLALWGGPGRSPGKLYSPWALAVDKYDRVHVIDSENHRVQRIRL